MEYTRNQEKLIKPKQTQKNPIKPKKTQPLPYKRSDWDRVFLGYTPPPPADFLIKIVRISLAFPFSKSFIMSTISKSYVSYR